MTESISGSSIHHNSLGCTTRESSWPALGCLPTIPGSLNQPFCTLSAPAHRRSLASWIRFLRWRCRRSSMSSRYPVPKEKASPTSDWLKPKQVRGPSALRIRLVSSLLPTRCLRFCRLRYDLAWSWEVIALIDGSSSYRTTTISMVSLCKVSSYPPRPVACVKPYGWPSRSYMSPWQTDRCRIIRGSWSSGSLSLRMLSSPCAITGAAACLSRTCDVLCQRS